MPIIIGIYWPMTSQEIREDMHVLQNKYPERMKLILYVCIGGSAAAIDFFFFRILRDQFDIVRELATAVSSTIAFLYAFTLNVRYNFKVKTHLFKRFVSYFAVHIVGMTLGVVFLYYFVTLGGHGENLIKIGSLPVIFVTQFILNRTITFHKNFFHKKG